MTRRVQVLFWLSFVYITVALVFWGRSLYLLSMQNISLKKEILKYQYTDTQDPEYITRLQELNQEIDTKKKQYWGEGLTFFAFILLSGIIVYVSLRREKERSDFQKNVLLSITHELKTPLASIKLALQTLQKRELSREAQLTVIEPALEDVNRLDSMTNNILSINSLESKQLEVNMEHSTAHTILRPIIADYSKAQKTHQIVLQGEDFDLKTDPYLLSILISNIVSNAIKYSPGKDTVVIKTLPTDDAGIIEIIDQGSGIKADEQDKVYKKYYRSGNEYTRTTKGTGLGLYIVRKICDVLHIDLDYAYTDGLSVFRIEV